MTTTNQPTDIHTPHKENKTKRKNENNSKKKYTIKI